MVQQMTEIAGGDPSARPSSRAPEMEDWLNANIFHPLARLTAVGLEPTGISPNMVSVMGGISVVTAGFLFTFTPWPTSALLGATMLFLWHVLDGADGDLARLTGKASPLGELVDGACDYVSQIILYVFLAAFLDDSVGAAAWWIAAASGASRIVQANQAESQRRTYLWRVYGIPWLRNAKAGDDEVFSKKGPLARFLTAGGRFYIGLAGAINPGSSRVDALVEAASADHRVEVRSLSRRAGEAGLRIQHWLGANPRSVMLSVSMAAGTPLWFFLYECVLLNILLAWSLRQQNRSNGWLAEQLERLNA